jgi:hypothetical protein
MGTRRIHLGRRLMHAVERAARTVRRGQVESRANVVVARNIAGTASAHTSAKQETAVEQRSGPPDMTEGERRTG